MSAQFVLKFREQFVRVVAVNFREVCEVCPRAEATVFTSEPEAWHAAYRLDLRPDFCRVEAAP